jgi:hypothetical protein
VALFGRRRDRRNAEQQVEPEYADAENFESGEFEDDDEFEPSQGDLESMSGPFDEADVPDDGIARLNLGSLLLPVPDEAQLQVEMAQPGVVKAVHVVTPSGQMTLQAYAAPRSGGLWQTVCGELAEQLKADGATVRSASGEWGQELMWPARRTRRRRPRTACGRWFGGRSSCVVRSRGRYVTRCRSSFRPRSPSTSRRRAADEDQSGNPSNSAVSNSAVSNSAVRKPTPRSDRS